MTRDVSVFVKRVTIFRLFFWKLPQFHTSNFSMIVRQHSEGMVGKYYMSFAGSFLGFPAVKEF